MLKFFPAISSPVVSDDLTNDSSSGVVTATDVPLPVVTFS